MTSTILVRYRDVAKFEDVVKVCHYPLTVLFAVCPISFVVLFYNTVSVYKQGHCRDLGPSSSSGVVLVLVLYRQASTKQPVSAMAERRAVLFFSKELSSTLNKHVHLSATCPGLCSAPFWGLVLSYAAGCFPLPKSGARSRQ